MKIVKGIAIYTLIILGALTLLGLILMGAMLIFPSFGLFGYNFQYKSYENISFDNFNIATFKTKNESISTNSPVVNLFVNNGDYNLYITPITSLYGEINSYTTNNYIGFVKTQEGEFKTSLSTTATIKDSQLSIWMDLNQPEGAVSFNEKNAFYINLPYYLSDGGAKITYNLYITSADGNVSLAGSTKDENFKALNADTISISSEKGDISIKGLEEKAENNKVVEDKDIELNSINISTKGGVVDFTNFDSITIKEKLVLNSTRADYNFNTLNAKKGVEVIGTNVRFTAKEVNAQVYGFVYKSDTGGLEINVLNCTNVNVNNIINEKNIYSVKDGGNNILIDNTTNWETHYKNYETTIITESALVKIDELLGKFGIENQYGNIEIKHCTNQGSIRNAHGNITINSSGYFNDDNANAVKGNVPQRVYAPASSLIIYNEYGNITVNRYYQKGVFTTESGDIKAYSYFNGLDEDKHYYSKITTENGNIDFTSEQNMCDLISTGKGNITAEIKRVLKQGETDVLTFDGESGVNYGFKVSKGKLTLILPSSQDASYEVLANGSISGNITTSSPIESGVKITILKDEETENPAYVRIKGGEVSIRGSY